MADQSHIEWTDATWNPVRGCTRISTGCKLRLVPEALDLPLRWRKPRRVFVNSMSDLFHEDVPDEFIARVFVTMADARQHTFQILTKRARRMREFFESASGRIHAMPFEEGKPLPHVWLGVSVEDQTAAEERIPHLLATPAAVRFASVEPLLGPVDLARWQRPRLPGDPPEWKRSVLTPDGPRPGLDWVIVGGESGPGARPCAEEWIRSIVKQCRAVAVPVFVKQLGGVPVMAEDAWLTLAADGPAPIIRAGAPPGFVRLARRDRKGGDPAEWPEDLRVRNWP